MCGLAGYIGKFHQRNLQSALDLISHRGPDDSGTFFREGLGMGHTRLSIIDTSDAGHQPMVNSETGNAIVFNGEIYNYRELRKELEIEGLSFSSGSDTEVLFALLSRFGISCVKKLKGIFAFGFYEAKSKKTYIVRDQFGTKPLYYCRVEDGFAFSSELPSLLSLVDVKIEAKMCASTAIKHLTYIWSSSDETICQGVFHLPQGSLCTIEPGGEFTIEKWHINPLLNSKNQTQRDDDFYVSNVYQHLSQAVERQMVSDVPLGAFLSGGLDSSSIVALAKEHNPNIMCFTMSSTSAGDGFADDLPYAKRAAEHLKVPLQVVDVNEELLYSNLERMISSLGEPIADPAALNTYFISKYARDRGIKVLLSGTGGDDIFTGYRRHRAANWVNALSLTPHWLFDAGSNISKAFGARGGTIRRLQKLKQNASLPAKQQIVNFYRWISSSALAPILAPKAAQLIENEYLDEELHKAITELPENSGIIDKMLYLEQKFFLPQHNLLYVDRMSMATGVEVRVPFLDEELVNFAAEIPDRVRQRRGEGKWVLKKAMERSLPQDLIYRPKTGFGAPLREWIVGPLQSSIEIIMSEETIKRRGLLDYGGFRKMIEINQSGRSDYSYTIFAALCIELWCQIFIDMSRPYSKLPT